VVSVSNWGHAVACLRHWDTRRKIAGSIPDGVIGIFHLHNFFGRTMALSSTRPLVEITTRNISWGLKAIVLKRGIFNFLETLGRVQACIGIALLLPVSSCRLRHNDPKSSVIVQKKRRLTTKPVKQLSVDCSAVQGWNTVKVKIRYLWHRLDAAN
jgi:hypothetical protein